MRGLGLGGVTAGGVSAGGGVGGGGLLADIDDTLEVGLQVETLRGELASGTGTELDGLDVARDIEVFLRVSTALGILDADREDGEVVDLDALAFEHQLLDTCHHVGEQTFDDTLGEGTVVTGHVVGKTFEIDGLLDNRIGVDLTVVVGLPVVVGLEFVRNHKLKCLEVRDYRLPFTVYGMIHTSKYNAKVLHLHRGKYALCAMRAINLSLECRV